MGRSAARASLVVRGVRSGGPVGQRRSTVRVPFQPSGNQHRGARILLHSTSGPRARGLGRARRRLRIPGRARRPAHVDAQALGRRSRTDERAADRRNPLNENILRWRRGEGCQLRSQFRGRTLEAEGRCGAVVDTGGRQGAEDSFPPPAAGDRRTDSQGREKVAAARKLLTAKGLLRHCVAPSPSSCAIHHEGTGGW